MLYLYFVFIVLCLVNTNAFFGIRVHNSIIKRSIFKEKISYNMPIKLAKLDSFSGKQINTNI